MNYVMLKLASLARKFKILSQDSVLLEIFGRYKKFTKNILK